MLIDQSEIRQHILKNQHVFINLKGNSYHEVKWLKKVRVRNNYFFAISSLKEITFTRIKESVRIIHFFFDGHAER